MDINKRHGFIQGRSHLSTCQNLSTENLTCDVDLDQVKCPLWEHQCHENVWAGWDGMELFHVNYSPEMSSINLYLWWWLTQWASVRRGQSTWWSHQWCTDLLSLPGLVLGLRPANERWHYFVTMSLIGWHMVTVMMSQITNNPTLCSMTFGN